MTFLEAINSIEKKVEKLHIRLKDDTPLAPVIAMGRIGRYHGSRYNFVIDSLAEGIVDVDWYYIEMIKMIREYDNRKERTSFDE